MRMLIPACLLVLALPGIAAELVQTETPLGSLPERVKPVDVTVSPDGQRYAYVRRRDWRIAAVVDGVEHPAFDWIVNQAVSFSPDSRHVIYQARTGRRTQMVLDALGQAFYDSIDNWMVSATGGKIAAAVQRENAAFIVLDGDEGRHWQRVRLGALSHAGDVLAYVGTENGEERVIIGDSRGRKYERIFDVCLTPDGEQYAYRSLGDRKWRIVVDGVEHKPYDHVSGPRLSDDGRHLTYTAVRGGQFLFVKDQQESPLFDEAELKPPALSPDGLRYAAVGRRGPRAHVVIDGLEKSPCDEVRPLPVFSADSKRIAYGAQAAGVCRLIVDDAPAGTFEAVHSITFSPDSRYVAAVVSQAGRMMIQVNGKPGPAFDEIRAMSLTFSPDSRHIAYAARRGDKWHVVLDGAETRPYDSLIFAGPLAFDANGALRLFATRSRQVEADLGRKAIEHDLFRLQVSLKPR